MTTSTAVETRTGRRADVPAASTGQGRSRAVATGTARPDPVL